MLIVDPDLYYLSSGWCWCSDKKLLEVQTLNFIHEMKRIIVLTPRRNKRMKGRFALEAFYPPHNDAFVIFGEHRSLLLFMFVKLKFQRAVKAPIW